MLDELSELFGDVADNHHQVFQASGGNDPDWAIWYARELLKTRDFVSLIGHTPSEMELTSILLKLDKNFLSNKSNQSWTEYYTDHIADFF
jgi:hypothetical protein